MKLYTRGLRVMYRIEGNFLNHTYITEFEHTHTRTHTHTHARAHIHSHARTHTGIHIITYSGSQIPGRMVAIRDLN